MTLRVLLTVMLAGGAFVEPAWSNATGSDGAWIPIESRVKAPKVALRDLAGQKCQLAALKGTIVVLNFWATWCEPCRHELPAFRQVFEDYKDRDVQVIGAANETNAARDQVVEYVRRVGMGFPVWLEASPDLMKALGVANVLPATVIVDRKGRIAARIEGETTFERLRALIEQLLLEVEVE